MWSHWDWAVRVQVTGLRMTLPDRPSVRTGPPLRRFVVNGTRTRVRGGRTTRAGTLSSGVIYTR